MVIVALAMGLTAFRPVTGHSCATPTRIKPGEPATVNIGVAAEEAAVVSVEVEVPEGFELDRVLEAPGWKSEQEESLVRFTGGKIEAFGCAYFGVAGMAEKKATLAFPLTVGMEGGGERRLASNKIGAPDSAQLVFAGTEPPSSVDPEEAGGTSMAAVAAVGLAVAGGLAAAAWAVRYALGATTRGTPVPTRRPTSSKPRRAASGSRKPRPKGKKSRRR